MSVNFGNKINKNYFTVYSKINMDMQLGFIIKLFSISTLFSLFIKYGAPFLATTPTTSNALVAISLPSLLIGLFLTLRNLKTSKED